jgi:hypothetical protein
LNGDTFSTAGLSASRTKEWPTRGKRQQTEQRQSGENVSMHLSVPQFDGREFDGEFVIDRKIATNGEESLK